MELIDYLKYDPQYDMTIAVGQSIHRFSQKPVTVLERWANEYGLGILGSHAAFKSRLCIRQKIPVLVDPFKQVYFFPTLSPQDVQCLWINASQIKAIKAIDLGSEIRFKNGNVLRVTIGRRSLIRQWERCKMMEALVLRHHLEENPIRWNTMP